MMAKASVTGQPLAHIAKDRPEVGASTRNGETLVAYEFVFWLLQLWPMPHVKGDGLVISSE